MKILALIVTIVGINILLFAARKVYTFFEPRILKLLFKNEDFSSVLNDPETKERSAARGVYTHLFWTLWLVLLYSIDTLTGLNYALAAISGAVLHIVGYAEASRLAEISAKHRSKEYTEDIEKVFLEIARRMQGIAPETKDVERN